MVNELHDTIATMAASEDRDERFRLAAELTMHVKQQHSQLAKAYSGICTLLGGYVPPPDDQRAMQQKAQEIWETERQWRKTG
jgi:hypothetical protein